MIKHLIEKAETEQDVEQIIISEIFSIVGTLGTSRRDYENASTMYNSLFFKDEPFMFTRALCRALIDHFATYPTNNYWVKAAGEEQ